MRAWIKYKGENIVSSSDEARVLIKKEDHNYTRFGKKIRREEEPYEIDILKYFNCDAEKGAYIASCLESDSKIKCILGDETKKAVARLKEIRRENLNAHKRKYQHNVATAVKHESSNEIENLKKEIQELKDEVVKKAKPVKKEEKEVKK